MRAIPVVCVSTVLLAACQAVPQYPARVAAQLQSATGGSAYWTGVGFGTAGAFGSATFDQAGSKVHVIVSAEGLTPGQQYGLRINKAGGCSQGAGESIGNLPWLKADSMGRGVVETDVDGVTVAAGPDGIVGRSLVIQSAPDDSKSQVACGAIGTTG